VKCNGDFTHRILFEDFKAGAPGAEGAQMVKGACEFTQVTGGAFAFIDGNQDRPPGDHQNSGQAMMTDTQLCRMRLIS